MSPFLQRSRIYMIFKMEKFSYKIILLFVIAALVGCGSEPFAPKRYEYFRISLPEHSYVECDSFKHCKFLMSAHSKVSDCDDTWATKSDQWYNLHYPEFNCDIHISYKSIEADKFYDISEESRTLAYKHSARASSISESFYGNDSSNVYGIMYRMGGAAASQVQFFMTDSVNHFLRGSLYFNNIPNPDSIAPVSAYVEEDILTLIESIEWE